MSKLNLTMDGNQWCATLPDFINLQESPAGFGDTQDGAIANLATTVTKEAGDARQKAASWELAIEHENYCRRPRQPKLAEQAVTEFKKWDAIADDTRDRLRLLRSILDPSNTMQRQIEMDFNALVVARQ